MRAFTFRNLAARRFSPRQIAVDSADVQLRLKRAAAFCSCLCMMVICGGSLGAKEQIHEIDSLAIEGGADSQGGRIVISATLGDPDNSEEEDELIYAVDTQSTVNVYTSLATQETKLKVDLKHGKLEVIELNLEGDLNLESVSGANVASWSVRNLSGQENVKKAAARQLIIRLSKPIESGAVDCVITATGELGSLPTKQQPLFFSPVEAGFLSGGMRIVGNGVLVDPVSVTGLLLLNEVEANHFAYRFDGDRPGLDLQLSHLRQPSLNFANFDLQGTYSEGGLRFNLTGKLEALYDQKRRVPLLSGRAALTEAPQIEGAEVTLDNRGYWLELEKAGTYAVELKFEALVRTENGSSRVEFDLIDAPLQPVRLSGMPVSKERVRLNSAPLQLEDEALVGSLAGDGVFGMRWTDPSWKNPQSAEASLIYATRNIAQVAVGNGVIRQRNDLDVQIMQGSIKALNLDLKGQGEVTRVESDAILSWKLEDDVLKLELNKAYTGDFPVQVHSQYTMGAFPIEAEPLRILPQGAIRHSGFIRILNQGAVSIDVTESSGFAQISPEYFPSLSEPMEGSGQMLAYRFSDMQYSYKIRAENILPEVSVSQILQYHVGQEDQSLTAEMELTIREAPLRDFFVRIPEGYALADLKVDYLADYFITEAEAEARTLRIVFSRPLSGRVFIQMELENNERLDGSQWNLPRFAALNVKSVRGHIGVSADPGLRVSVVSMEGLSEQAANFFPKKVPQLQLGLRMRDPVWQAQLGVEELPQSIQADVLHLYSVAEGRIYGSSVINFMISGAPVSNFQIQVTDGVQNLDFAGRDVRGWSDEGGGLYEVQLHSPAAGAYTFLATYEKQFDSQGATVDFSGVTPLGVDSEQGYVVVVSNFPFALGGVTAAANILRLEPGEIPAEFRLLYDAKELAAFQYSDRPMQVVLELRSFEQAEGADQVIDFVELNSHISRDGEVLTAVDLMLKSKGQTHFRMALPPEHRIWSARVAGEKVSPIAAEGGILLPLPAGQDPNNAVRIQLELASQAEDAGEPVVTAPALFAPALMMKWELTSDPGHGLRYIGGDISSLQVSRPTTGFAWFQALIQGELGHQRVAFLGMVLFGLLAIVVTRIMANDMEPRPLFMRLFLVLGLLLCVLLVAVCGLNIGGRSAQPQYLKDSLTLSTPIELSSQPLSLTVENLEYKAVKHSFGSLWPFVLGVGLWVLAFIRTEHRGLLWGAGWVVNFLAALHYSASGALFLVLVMLFFFVYMLRPFRMRYLQRVGAHALWLLAMLCGALLVTPSLDAATQASGDSLTQDVQVDGDFATIKAKLLWSAAQDEQTLLLKAPAVLLGTGILPEGLRLIQTQSEEGMRFHLYAESAGDYTVDFRYQVKVEAGDGSRVVLPVGTTLSSLARIEIDDTSVSLTSGTAVSVSESDSTDGSASVFDLVFNPARIQAFSWKPKQRDSSGEVAVYHVESFDVFTPLSGLVSGLHQHKIRLSQGQVDRLQLQVPAGMTITSVQGRALASWQFDPDRRQLLCFFGTAQSGAFELNILSQYGAGSLPYSREVESIEVVGAASQLSLVALATGEEVQIGNVDTGSATTINLEDFPAANVEALKHLGRVPTLRRAYRWGASDEPIVVQALPVRPDLRVSTRQTVSLGEDRILLKAEITAQVNRAGLFKFSMPIPADFDVEAVSGSHLSHWNELSLPKGGRSLQLHLKGKTVGETMLQLSFSGPGLGDRTRYEPPILMLDRTDRQSGTLALVPELGYRLEPVEREAALQLDPAESGMSRQKLRLFRILNGQAKLVFSVERVEPWIEVAKLQRVSVRSGLTEVKVRYNFNVENAGIRAQRFRLPTEVIGVQFSGEGVVDAEEGEDGIWTVKLNRKMVGAFTVELSYQMPMADRPDSIGVTEAMALDVDQQSGFLALVPQGRIQLDPDGRGNAFQSTEAPMVAAKLRGDLDLETASHLYRVVQPGQPLQVGIKRHAIAELVPAQVRDVHLASVISGQGSMLTKVTLKLDPGDKRMLRISLPGDSRFWFGFVNRQSVWPWREGADVLLQLEANTVEGEDSTVEFYYATESVADPKGKLRASLRGPRLDLPLENIQWSINYPDTWDIEEWAGNLTQERVQASRGSFSDISSYLRSEKESRQRQKVVAETYLDSANQLLVQGKQQEARQAFNSAYNLSQFDAALNEDARVQLKNVREEQALVALANRRNSFANDNPINAGEDQPQAAVIGQSRLLNYTDQAKREVLGGNSAEENETLRVLAARLIDQQQAVPGSPQAIQTVVPQEGQVVSFTRSLQINDQAELSIELRGQRQPSNDSASFSMLLFLIALVGGVSYVARR